MGPSFLNNERQQHPEMTRRKSTYEEGKNSETRQTLACCHAAKISITDAKFDLAFRVVGTNHCPSEPDDWNTGMIKTVRTKSAARKIWPTPSDFAFKILP
jgi:hypothetical protein